MTELAVSAAALDAAFPTLAPFGDLQALTGGSLNLVWRVPCKLGSAVVKHAPPHVATVPSIALAQSRLLFEAGALHLFDGGSLAHVTTPFVRPPRILGFHRAHWLLVEEDLGPGVDLSSVLNDERACSELGSFIGALHAESLGSQGLRRRFQNTHIQRTRLEAQYAQVTRFAERAGAPDAAVLGASALDLGRRLLSPGRCLVMGDLWPPSVLIREAGMRIIDWEFATYGSPAQDVAHLLAHLVMIGAVRADHAMANRTVTSFLTAYRKMAGTRFHALWDDEVMRDAGVHLGCELLARAWGPFQASGPLAGYAPTSPAHQFITELGLHALRDPLQLPVLSPLQ